MNKLSYIIAGIILIVVTWEVKARFFPDVRELVRSDTVRIDVPYEVTVREEIKVPETVIEYRTRTDTVQTVKLVQDTVYITTVNENKLQYNTKYLTNYPTAPKFLEMNATSDYIEFTGMDIDGNTQSSRWSYEDFYRITLSEGNWVSFSGERGRNYGTFQEFGVGYLYGVDPSPYGQYTFGYEYGKFSIKSFVIGAKNPYIGVGINYKR